MLWKQRQVAELLIAHGADVKARNATGGTALHDAALAGNREVVELLLDKGAEIDAREHDSGATALMVAAGFGRTEVVKALVGRGANKALKNNAGKTAAELAREGGFAEAEAALK